MNAIAGIRPQPFVATSYRAFIIEDRHTKAINIGEPASLQEALTAAQFRCFHKQHLAIREASEEGVKVHLYAIRRKSAQWIHEVGDILPKRVADLYADPVCVMDGEIFG